MFLYECVKEREDVCCCVCVRVCGSLCVPKRVAFASVTYMLHV